MGREGRGSERERERETETGDVQPEVRREAEGEEIEMDGNEGERGGYNIGNEKLPQSSSSTLYPL